MFWKGTNELGNQQSHSACLSLLQVKCSHYFPGLYTWQLSEAFSVQKAQPNLQLRSTLSRGDELYPRLKAANPTFLHVFATSHQLHFTVSFCKTIWIWGHFGSEKIWESDFANTKCNVSNSVVPHGMGLLWTGQKKTKQSLSKASKYF